MYKRQVLIVFESSLKNSELYFIQFKNKINRTLPNDVTQNRTLKIVMTAWHLLRWIRLWFAIYSVHAHAFFCYIETECPRFSVFISLDYSFSNDVLFLLKLKFLRFHHVRSIVKNEFPQTRGLCKSFSRVPNCRLSCHSVRIFTPFRICYYLLSFSARRIF